MLTKGIWEDFIFKKNYKWYFHYLYDTSCVAWLLMGTIIFTPITLILDLLFFPIEIIYLICYGIIKKARGGKE